MLRQFNRHLSSSIRESIQPVERFGYVSNRLRSHFLAKGFTELHPQSKLSIMAACEDPWTVSTMEHDGQTWPLPQTGQMWLEDFILRHTLDGVFCVTTSYRNEPNPKPDRHKKTFPMFEYESWGTQDDMIQAHTQMLTDLGFEPPFPSISYQQAADQFGVRRLDHSHEEELCNQMGPIVFLCDFPIDESFWNMRLYPDGETTKKVDVLIHGQETIGSAERSCDVEEMRKMFHTISEGGYSELLFGKFGKERVLRELEKYLGLEFKPRFGAGIGMDRLERGMEKSGLI